MTEGEKGRKADGEKGRKRRQVRRGEREEPCKWVIGRGERGEEESHANGGGVGGRDEGGGADG